MTDARAPKNIDEALLILQRDPPVLLKDQDGQVGNQKTKYADLVQANEKILSRLTELGVLWKTKPTTKVLAGPNGSQDMRFVLDWTLLHVASGTFEQGDYPLPGGANPMQNGSAITYARRYALIAVTNTVAEGMDDDGQGYRGRQGMAQRANVRQEQRQPAPQTAQRAAPAPRAERARPPAQPDLPARPTSPAPQQAATAPTENLPSDEPFRGRGGLITLPMTRKLAICMKDTGLVEGTARQGFLIDLLGRNIDSSKELTYDEGRHLIDAFEKAKSTPDPQTEAATIYLRTTGGAAEPAPTGSPSAREQTRSAVLGNPDGGGADEEPPWEPQPGEIPGVRA